MRASTLATLVGLLLACIAGPAQGQTSAAAKPQNPFDADNRRLAAKAAQQGRRPEGVLPLYEIWSRWDDSTPARTRALLEKLEKDPRLSPDRQVLVRAMAADARARTGDSRALSEAYAELGYLSQWRVIGPFDNEGKTGFDKAFPPEDKRMEAPDLQASYTGRERPVSWREYPQISRRGYVSFGSIMRPRQNVCAYAETFVHSERTRALSLWAGAGGAIKVWWNGQEVLSDAAYRGPHRERSVAMVGAHAGPNRLLVKVCVTSAAWGFYLRLGDARGGALADLRVEPNSSAALDIPAGHAKLALPRAPVPPLAALEKRAEGNEPGAKALVELARFLRYTGSDDPAERRAKQLAARAADAAPTLDNLKVAALLAEERAEKQRFAARAAEVARDNPRALMLRAQVLAEGPVPEDALELIDRVPFGGTAWPAAQVLRGHILRDLELPSASLRIVEDVIARTGETVRLLHLLAGINHSVGDVDRSLEIHRRIIELRHDDAGSRRVLIADALNRGATAEVLEQLQALVEVSPGGLGTLRYVADIYDALGRDDLTLATYRRAMTIVPESAPIHVEYGKALQRAGQDELAADAYFRALELKPQDAATRERLEQIKPRPRPDEAYAMSSDQVLKLRRESADYPSTVLTDLSVKTVFENGLGSSFRQFAAQAHDDEGARQYRSYSIQYDPDTQRVDLRLARVYRKDGRVLESVRTYEQQLGEPWYRIYYDTRAIVVVFPDLEPGDVIEIRYRIDDVAHRNLFADYYGDLHIWQRFTPVVRAEYVLITPKSREFYVNQPKLATLKHERKVDGERRIDHYVATDIPAVVAEAGMPGITEVSPYLHVSTYRTWEDVGQWYWGLIKDQLYADAELKERVAELVAGKQGTREKVAAIHNWVVQNTRYVGLEFGIHGFLPYRVPLIVQRGFGDCKDKASLMYTMFREAGIDARIVLVRTRRNGQIKDLPASLAVFDHAIAYVPELDLYLDGTAEHSGTGELPVQDQGVTVLLVGPEGAELRSTPVSEASDNERTRTLSVALAPDGSARVKGEEVVRGAEAAGYRSYYQASGTRAERFQRALGSIYPGLSLESQKFGPLADLESPVRYEYSIDVPQLATWDGDELRLPPSVLRDLVRSMARLPTRKHTLDLEGNRAYVEDRRIELPSGMVAAELPSGGEASSPFGRLKLDFEKAEGQVRARTEFSVTRDRVLPQDYPAFRRWVEEADQLLRQRIGIRKDEDRP